MPLDPDRLKKSWALVAEYGDQVPLFFYSTLFLHNPHLRDMFPVSMADQRDKLVAALGKVISGVDELDAVVPVLQQLGRDHRKFAVVRDHYPAVGHALVATLEHFSGPEWTPELAHDWVTAYGIVADVMIGAAEAAADQPPWWELTVTDIERRAVDIAVLRVVPHQPLAYVAGQSIAVEVPQRPRLWRYLTPAGAPGADGSFELHVRVVAGGVVSTAIVQGTRAGDVWRAGAPVGTQLTLAPGPGPDVVMLAGGTGLAPMKALLAQIEADGGSRSAQLFWGARTARELYDLPAVAAIARRSPWLQVVPCVSDEPVLSGQVASGTVAAVALDRRAWRDHEVYICGSPEMVRDTCAAVTRAGADPRRIHIEEFGSEETTP
jgi:NAD(P)H-flavin reductase/hemoglobin-like flavoprotein